MCGEIALIKRKFDAGICKQNVILFTISKTIKVKGKVYPPVIQR
jgi:hypothetical protein